MTNFIISFFQSCHSKFSKFILKDEISKVSIPVNFVLLCCPTGHVALASLPKSEYNNINSFWWISRFKKIQLFPLNFKAKVCYLIVFCISTMIFENLSKLNRFCYSSILDSICTKFLASTWSNQIIFFVFKVTVELPWGL